MATDVVIVGGGIIGLASAWRAAQRGLRVSVVDPDPGVGASYVAAGMLAPVTEVHYGEEPMLRLTLESAARYPSFVAELEDVTVSQVGYRRCGMLAVALDAGDRAVLDDLGAFQHRLGLDVESKSGRECRRLEPLLAPSVQGGLLVTDDHQVDPRRLTAALLVAAEKSGVDIVRRTVIAVATRDGVATGVHLDDGSELNAATVVLAAGSRSGEIDGVPDTARPPVRPVKGQVVRLRVPPAYRPFLSRTVRGTVRGSFVYLVPREDGELVIGATQEEQGFDEQVTAGGVYQLLRDAHELVPAVTELPLVEARAGLRPGTPDNAPLVGPTGVPGLVLATGHYRQGILLTPVTADAVATLLADGDLSEQMAPFTPARFLGDEVIA
ncbi:MAG: glycine oxidase ThiO [Actinomycetota bacterium]